MKKLFILLTLTFMVSFFTFSENFSVILEKENQLPEFTLYTLEGEKILSKNVMNKNKKTIIVPVAEWCPDCHEELPVLEDFYKKNKNKYNFIVIFVESRSSIDKVKEFVKGKDFTFPMYYDYNSIFSDGAQIKFIPTNIFLDKDRKISDVFVGTIDDIKDFEKYFNK